MTHPVAHILVNWHLSETERKELRQAIVERVLMSDDLTGRRLERSPPHRFRSLDERKIRVPKRGEVWLVISADNKKSGPR